MNKKIRFFLAIVILLVSISLLAWGYWPNAHETRVQLITSSQMQLPATP